MMAGISLLTACYRDDKREYALKQIEGTGISMSACREISVILALLMFHFKSCIKLCSIVAVTS